MRWFIPYSKLSPKQIQVIMETSRDLERPHWIQGFAGSGKTVVISHLMEGVARIHPGASICFITYTHALKDMVSSGLQGDVARRIKVLTHTQFLSNRETFDFVFLDEVQDISATDLERIRKLAKNIYIAGDPDQRIYGERATETDVTNLFKPKLWRLIEVFRLTERLRAVAMRIFPGARVVEGEMAKNMADVSIVIARVEPDADAEASWVWKEAQRAAKIGEPSVILFPTHDDIAVFARRVAKSLGLPQPRPVQYVQGRKDYGEFNAFWREERVPLMFLGSGFGSFAESDLKPLVYLMTFHSSKGLDFENVFIPCMNTDTRIVSDRIARGDQDLERRLLFVAVSRSRRNLFITHTTARPHPLLSDLPSDAAVFTTVNTGSQQPVGGDGEDFF